MREQNKFIDGLPKAELHLHIEGSLEPDLMFALAKRNKMSLPFKSVEDVRAAYQFSRLQDFLDIYYAGAGVLRTEGDFRDLAIAYFERAVADGVVHAEIFFDPQTHTCRGIPFHVIANGLLSAMEDAEDKHGISSKLILCFLRHLDEESALKTLKEAEPWLGPEKIVGVGLDSSEVGNPPSKFERVFAQAGSMGLKRVAHAGEEGPAAYVREALDQLRVDRIDHGNHSLDDPTLVARLAREAVALTVCPLSNLKLHVVTDMADHPIGHMLSAGLRATVNSDDPAYFGGYVADNYRAIAEMVGRDGLITLARNSLLGSFLDDDALTKRLGQLNAFVATA
jgi:adenosine deaminase